MNLQEIRAQFVKMSGRADLASADGATDYGADFFINAGQRWLDRQLDVWKAQAHYYKEVAANTHLVSIKLTRAIQYVSVALSDGTERDEVIKASLLDAREYYGKVHSLIDTSKPKYYFPVSLRRHPDTDTETVPAILMDETIASDEEYNGLILLPPTDQTYILEVVGLFYSKPLSTITDVTYWSSVHPDLLILASLMRLEAFYRNTQGYKDYLTVLDDDVRKIDMDAVAQQIVDIDQMEG